MRLNRMILAAIMHTAAATASAAAAVCISPRSRIPCEPHSTGQSSREQASAGTRVARSWQRAWWSRRTVHPGLECRQSPAGVDHIRTELDGKPVRLILEYASLANGPFYAARTTILLPKKDTVVHIDTFDYSLSEESKQESRTPCAFGL